MLERPAKLILSIFAGVLLFNIRKVHISKRESEEEGEREGGRDGERAREREGKRVGEEGFILN